MPQNNQLDQASADFVAKMATFGTRNGAPRSLSRVMGYLLICEPALQSAEDIQEKLSLSVGSVSTALTALQRIGLVTRSTLPAGRRYYYEIDSEGWKRSLKIRLRAISEAKDMATEGLKISPNNLRLQTMHDIYETLGAEIEAIVEKHNL